MISTIKYHPISLTAQPPWACSDRQSGGSGAARIDPLSGGSDHTIAFASYARSAAPNAGSLVRQHACNAEAGRDLPGRHVGNFTDVGKAGDGFREMLARAHSGDFEAIVIGDVDRLARDLSDCLRMYEQLVRHVAVYVVKPHATTLRPTAIRLSGLQVALQSSLGSPLNGRGGR